MKKITTVLMTLFTLCLLGACHNTKKADNQGSSNGQSTAISKMPKIDGITYHGDIPENPKKVLNFAYSYTGYLALLDINVASYTYDLEKNSPAFGDRLAKAVQLTTEDTEAIATQEPDLILVFAGDPHLEALKAIAPVIEITYGKADYLQMLTDLASIFGKEERAKTWLKAWDKKVATAKKDLASLVSPDTTFTIMDFFDKNITVYGDSFGRGGELIYDALGFSAPQAIKKEVIDKDDWLTISQEVVGNYIGDYTVLNVTDSTKDGATSLTESDVWKATKAYKDGHVLQVDGNLFYFNDPLSLELQLKAFVQAIKEANN